MVYWVCSLVNSSSSIVSRNFSSASKELDSSKHHDISPNGYNLGRDWLVERAVHGGRWKGHWWKAEVEWRTDLIDEGSDGRCPPHKQ
jgi:hypothetical protein